jgi:1-acyl-sn-glycerol-3-phosphate acyltransferase
MKNLLYFSRSVLFNLLLISWTIFLGGIFFPLLLIPGAKFLFRLAKFWAKGICFLLLKICKIKINIQGMENIPLNYCIVASKHQSALDIILLIAVLKNPVFIMKESLLYLPVIGNFGKKMGMIAINRKGGASSLKKMLKSVVEALNNDRSVIIFPEGTRTAPGANTKYHSGILAIYQAAKSQVLPVALNTGICWKRNSFIKLPGVVTVKFLPAIPNDIAKELFMARLQEEIESESRLLLE